MVLWRISNYDSLDGIGGLLASGRWHSRGRPILYLTLHPATALLETLVHMEIDAEDRPAHIQVLKIGAPDTASRQVVEADSLPSGWRGDTLSTREIGNRWLASRASLLLEVPSVLVPETANILVNPAHPEAGALEITQRWEHPLDPRF